MKKFLILVLAFGFLCSCASSTGKLQLVTAGKVGNTLIGDVTIYNVQRGATTVSWQAKTPTGCYQCDADDMLRQVNIVKIDCSKIDMSKGPEK
jgi:hypothetical protein